MKRTVLISCTFLFSFVSAIYAQEKLNIDYAKIKKIVLSGDTTYTHTLKRYNAFDSTLTIKDYALVYYGTSFLEPYTGSGVDSKNRQELDACMKNEDYEKAKKLCLPLLKLHPGSLYANNTMKFICLHYFDEKFVSYSKRLEKLYEMIALTGDGETEKTAFKVISVSDEYIFMFRHLRIPKILSQGLTASKRDAFSIVPGKEYKKEKIYFDISRGFDRILELQMKKNSINE